MRRIIKKSPPPNLQSWMKQNASLNHSYNDISAALRDEMKDRLLMEQGFLCAYTGLRIAKETSHIEHLKPQAKCEDGEDTDWANLVAAHPAPNATASIGAQPKADWWDEHLFVSPLSAGCEQRFRFSLASGKLSATSATDIPATTTIEKLRLDHPELRELRSVAFERLSELSDAKLREFITRVDTPDASGRLSEFCFAMKQAAADLIHRREREKQRRAAINRAKSG